MKTEFDLQTPQTLTDFCGVGGTLFDKYITAKGAMQRLYGLTSSEKLILTRKEVFSLMEIVHELGEFYEISNR